MIVLKRLTYLVPEGLDESEVKKDLKKWFSMYSYYFGRVDVDERIKANGIGAYIIRDFDNEDKYKSVFLSDDFGSFEKFMEKIYDALDENKNSPNIYIEVTWNFGCVSLFENFNIKNEL